MVDLDGRKKALKNLPFWLPRKSNAIWYVLFVGLFLLSMDFWGWEQSKPLILGLPLWTWYLLVLTLSTSLAFYVFARFVWREDK
jgi:hypothetical protein